MKINKWTLGLAAAGVVSLGSVAMGEEAQNQVLTALSSTTISGFVDTVGIWNFDNDANTVPGRAFDGTSKQDGFNLNVVALRLNKPMDESAWSAGYNVDLLLGPDANTYFGGLNSAQSAGLTSDFAVKQANVELRVPVGNGLDLKVGTFDTIVGYEVYDSGANPNFSRSYGYFIEPYAHTGVLATYQVSDSVGLVGGYSEATVGVNTINARSANSGTKSYMGGVSLTAPEGTGILEGASLFAGFVDGGNAGAGNPTDLLHLYVGGSTPTPVDGLSLGFAWDYQDDAVADATGGLESQWTAAGYVSYQVPDSKLTLNGRFEYATTDGAKGAVGTLPVGGFAGTGSDELISVTVTADYALWDNVTSRLEARWDSADDNIFGGPAGAPDSDEAFSLALNLIYHF